MEKRETFYWLKSDRLTFDCFQIPRSRSLRQYRINYKFMCLLDCSQSPLFFRGILETGRLRWNRRHLCLYKRARSEESI